MIMYCFFLSVLRFFVLPLLWLEEFDTERVFLAKDLGLAALDENVERFEQDVGVDAM